MGAQPSLYTAPFWELLKCWHLGPPPDSDVIGFGAVQVVKMSWWYQGVAQAKSLLLWLDYSSWGWLTSSVSVQSFSCVQVFVTLWIHQASLPITNSQSLLKLMSIESLMSSNHLILCRPRLLLPPIPPSIRVFSNESVFCIRWPKYGSFSFSISPSNEYLGLISFRMDWLDLLAVQGTLKSFL